MSGMSSYTFKTKHLIPKKRDDVFSFFSNMENIQKVIPEKFHVRILSEAPVEMKEGVRINWESRVLGVRIPMETCIAKYNPPCEFTDLQTKGLLKWEHTHIFSEQEAGACLVEDEVKYFFPFGLLGKMVHQLWFRDYIRRFFEYRYRMVERYLEE